MPRTLALSSLPSPARDSRIAFAARVLASVLALAATIALAATPAFAANRLETPGPEAVLLAKSWPDHRIVLDAKCLGLDGGRYACQLRSDPKPASVPSAEWDRLAAAVRSGDTVNVRLALGILPTETQPNVAKVLHDWHLDTPATVMVGLTHAGSQWTVAPSPLTAAGFSSVDKLKADLRAAVPSMEQWGADHSTYAGATATTLRTYDRALNRNIVVYASKNTYCLSLSASGVTVAYHQGGTVVFGRCR